MGRGVGQLTAAVAFLLMMGRLGRVLQTGQEHPEWQLILAASLFLGAVGWWLLDQTTSRRWIKLVVFLFAGSLLALRIAVPETLANGFLPTSQTWPILADEFDQAFRLIRSGVAPVVPHPGIVTVLAVVMWVIGALFAWGATSGPNAAMFVPLIVMYLQFAVFDRTNAGLGWLVPSAILIGLALLALALDNRQETGRARDSDGVAIPRRSAASAAVVAGVVGLAALVVADASATVISEYGNAPWRGRGGIGDGPGSGGVTFDGLVGLRQRIISRENAVMFRATLSDDAPPAGEIYWRMDTLDTFDGEEWSRSDTSLLRYEPGQPLVADSDIYAGATSEFLQRVQIDRLNQGVVPTAGVPLEVQNAVDAPNARFPTEFHSLGGAALAIPSGIASEDTYQLRTVVADRTADLGGLASTPDGQLSEIFAGAAAEGLFDHQPTSNRPQSQPPPDLDRYTDLPEDTPESITDIAQLQTRGATTEYEKAWMLQAWFRDSGAFDYSTDVSTGHDALVLEDWLTDRSSPNFREGYCEQFSASMAVLARALGLPTRVVWGFTPGVAEEINGVTTVTVRDTNAHAWVEVWIDPYGWVQFDPTPRGEFQPESITADFDPRDYVTNEIDLDAPSVETPSGNLGGELEGLADDPVAPVATDSPRYWLIAIVTLGLAGVLIPLFKNIRRRRRLNRVRDGDISAAWEEIVDRLTDLGRVPSAASTPIEVARDNDPALMPLAMSYSASIYGGRPRSNAEEDLMGAEWWLERTTDRSTKTKAAFSLKSVLRR